MKLNLITFVLCLQLFNSAKAQDTFSILAFDSLTHEIGAAGASCVDLFNVPGYPNDFICEILPDTGAIASQASYLPANQANARGRMRLGDTPSQLMTWLDNNDVFSNSSIRQYGAIMFVNGSPQTAAFTGSNCMNYKNHITGPNYTMHGNILLGQKVLDSMEAGFKRAKGDLACKLMGAMQGAKMVGADSRCAPNNSSSLFAFLKVSQPGDSFGNPSFIVSVRTHSNALLEPIDSLQKLFNIAHTCTVNTTGLSKADADPAKLRIFPNPAKNELEIKTGNTGEHYYIITDMFGKKVKESVFMGELTLNIRDLSKGMYIIEVGAKGWSRQQKLVIN